MTSKGEFLQSWSELRIDHVQRGASAISAGWVVCIVDGICTWSGRAITLWNNISLMRIVYRENKLRAADQPVCISGVVQKHKKRSWIYIIAPFAENRWHRCLRQKRLTSPQKWHARRFSVHVRKNRAAYGRVIISLWLLPRDEGKVGRFDGEAQLDRLPLLRWDQLGEIERPGVLMCFVLFMHFCISFSLCHFVLEVERVSFKFLQDLVNLHVNAHNMWFSLWPTCRLVLCNSHFFRGQVLPTSGVCTWLLQSMIPGKGHQWITLAMVAEWLRLAASLQVVLSIVACTRKRYRWGIPKKMAG